MFKLNAIVFQLKLSCQSIFILFEVKKPREWKDDLESSDIYE